MQVKVPVIWSDDKFKKYWLQFSAIDGDKKAITKIKITKKEADKILKQYLFTQQETGFNEIVFFLQKIK